MSPLVQERSEFGHEIKFPLVAFTPAQTEWLHQIGELLAIEDHSLEDSVDEGRQRFVCQTMSSGEIVNLLGLLLSLE